MRIAAMIGELRGEAEKMVAVVCWREGWIDG